MFNDVRYALRSFRRTPGFTALVIATLAIGIGANTAMFSVVNAVLLRPFGYHDVDSLLRIRRGTSHPDLVDISRRATTIAGIEGFRPQLFDYTTGSDAERLDGMLVTGGLLHVVRRHASRRAACCSRKTTVTGAARTVLLSTPFWRSHFGGDPSRRRALHSPERPVLHRGRRPVAVVSNSPRRRPMSSRLSFPTRDAKRRRGAHTHCARSSA